MTTTPITPNYLSLCLVLTERLKWKKLACSSIAGVGTRTGVLCSDWIKCAGIPQQKGFLSYYMGGERRDMSS